MTEDNMNLARAYGAMQQYQSVGAGSGRDRRRSAPSDPAAVAGRARPHRGRPAATCSAATVAPQGRSASSRAINIVGGLRGSLNREAGGEIAAQPRGRCTTTSSCACSKANLYATTSAQLDEAAPAARPRSSPPGMRSPRRPPGCSRGDREAGMSNDDPDVAGRSARGDCARSTPAMLGRRAPSTTGSTVANLEAVRAVAAARACSTAARARIRRRWRRTLEQVLAHDREILALAAPARERAGAEILGFRQARQLRRRPTPRNRRRSDRGTLGRRCRRVGPGRVGGFDAGQLCLVNSDWQLAVGFWLIANS
ncbi:MAG: flagellar protein FliS [Chromatiales bacterium]|nr:flagellar protein FliS [Chromatiales bacterium]